MSDRPSGMTLVAKRMGFTPSLGVVQQAQRFHQERVAPNVRAHGQRNQLAAAARDANLRFLLAMGIRPRR